MRKVKLVKCRLHRNGHAVDPARSGKPGNGSGNGSNVRYIPLEEFHLWRYYMEQEHGFAVEDAEISYWADDEALMEWAEQIAPERLEAVVEIRFFARSSEAGTAIPVRRFLSGENYGDLRDLLLKHYPALHSSAKDLVPELKENRGFFLRTVPARS